MHRLILTALAIFVCAPTVYGQSAEELIPFKKLNVQLRQEIWAVAKQYSVRRKLKLKTVDCRASTFNYLLSQLPLASKVVRDLKLGEYKIREVKTGNATENQKPIFAIDDNHGAFANCEIAYQESQRVILVARGFVDAPLIPKVHGTGVIIIRSRNIAKQKVQVDCRLYFKLKNKALHEASKAFRKTLGQILDQRFSKFVDCAAKLAEQIESNPKRVFQSLQRTKASPELIADFRRRFSTY